MQCRLANLLWKHKDIETFWGKVVETRTNKSTLGISGCQNGFAKVYWDVDQLVDALEERIGYKAPKEVDKSVTNETINAAAEMFIYLTFCRNGGNAAWAQLYKNLFQDHNPDVILITLNRLMKTSHHDVAKNILEYLEIKWDLKFQSVVAGSNRMNSSIARTLRLIFVLYLG